MEIIRDLRLGRFDVLVGINLLREGLDIPEVSLVSILDADKEGFLRSERSLIQTCGRAARNVVGEVILYGSEVTASMARTVEETNRRRQIQAEYNEQYGITPETIRKEIRKELSEQFRARKVAQEAIHLDEQEYDRTELASQLEAEMLAAAEALDFERAAVLRDQLKELKALPELKESAGSRPRQGESD